MDDEERQDKALQTYCIIGDPVDHSLSPAMYNAVFKALRMNCVYIAFRVKEGELEAGLDSLRKVNMAGFNITMPHKVAIMKLLDELDSTCLRINAVNTVKRENGTFKGYNTDMAGFIRPIKQRKIELAGKNVLLMGAGGAARAVLTALADERVGRVIIANRNVARARDAAEHAMKLNLDCALVTLEEATRLASDADFIVNATPMGMKNEPSLIGPGQIRGDSVVYDLVYRPMETPLIRSAREAGAGVIYGYEMLVEQGAMSFEIWKEMEAPRDVMKKSLLGELFQQQS